MTLLLLAATLCHAAPAKLGDAANWAAAKHAVTTVSPHIPAALLVAIRYSECPLRRWDYKALGIKRGRGWWPGGLAGQYNKGADIVARHATRHRWGPLAPTRAQVCHLGTHYAEGSTSWGAQVWALYQRAIRGGMVCE